MTVRRDQPATARPPPVQSVDDVSTPTAEDTFKPGYAHIILYFYHYTVNMCSDLVKVMVPVRGSGVEGHQNTCTAGKGIYLGKISKGTPSTTHIGKYFKLLFLPESYELFGRVLLKSKVGNNEGKRYIYSLICLVFNNIYVMWLQTYMVLIL